MMHLLAYWYSHQEMCVRWNSVLYPLASQLEMASYRVHGVLSLPFQLLHIRGMIRSIANCTVGCNIGNMSVNILALC